jgi:hypothetical protein
MGWWRCEHGIIGDWPADVMGDALAKIEDIYLRETGRLPTQGEMANLVEFCTCGVLRPACGDPNHSYTRATRADRETPRSAKPGAQGLNGVASCSGARPDEMANVNPETGLNYKQSDVKAVLAEQKKEVENRRQMGEEGDLSGYIA